MACKTRMLQKWGFDTVWRFVRPGPTVLPRPWTSLLWAVYHTQGMEDSDLVTSGRRTCGTLQLLADDTAESLFQGLPADVLRKGFINQRLVAPLAGFGLEVFDNDGIEKHIDSPLAAFYRDTPDTQHCTRHLFVGDFWHLREINVLVLPRRNACPISL
jgi:hypothetical protein